VNVRFNRKAECSFCGEQVWFGEQIRDGRILCAACRPCVFIERHLCLCDEFSGQPFVLVPWMRTELRTVFGTLDDEGHRVIRDCYWEFAKKNAKTVFAAAIGLFCFVGEGIPGQRIYLAASAKDQARFSYRCATTMVRHSPQLRKELKILESTGRIVRRSEPESFLAIISGDGDYNDGLNPSVAIRDELHRWRTRKALELARILSRSSIT